jgi:hypothetical protein
LLGNIYLRKEEAQVCNSWLDGHLRNYKSGLFANGEGKNIGIDFGAQLRLHI